MGQIYTEYGGFARRLSDGEEELLFLTTFSPLLAEMRTMEKVREFENWDREPRYDARSVKVKQRTVLIECDEWREVSGAANLSAALYGQKKRYAFQ